MTVPAVVPQPGDPHARPGEHDSDAWETVSGWLWSCRTCLAKGWAISEADAQEKRARHDAGPIPWWAVRMNRSQP